MRSGSLISLLVAIVFGGLAAFLARGLVQGSGPATSRTVVVASQPVGFGALLSTENLKEIAWPHDSPIEGAFSSIASLLKDGRRLALANMQRNEPVLASKVTAPNQRATLSTQIDEGMRAVSIRVDEVRGVAGFVLPGDRVDVVLTRGEGGVQESAAFADILIQNAKVLAVDQVANERQDKPTVARAVTLELPVEQAQKVILAQGIGRLSLILRQAGQAGTDAVQRVTAADLTLGKAAIGKDRLADVERRLDELKAATDRADQMAAKNQALLMADAEARARAARPILPQSTASIVTNPIVTVIRNVTKREQYTVAPER